MTVYVERFLNFDSKAAKQTDTQRNSFKKCWRRTDKLKVSSIINTRDRSTNLQLTGLPIKASFLLLDLYECCSP